MKAVERIRGTAWAAVGILGMSGLSGCVTEGPTRTTRSLPSQPSSAEVTSVQIFATPPRDTDSNGYADTVSVTVFLWDEQRYPGPILVPGTMKLELRRPDGTVLAKWSITQSEAAAAVQQFQPGPGYSLTLGLRAAGVQDKLDAQAVDLTVLFTPEKGKPVSSLGGTTLRLGRLGM